MHDVFQDIRYAARTLAKAPGFTAVVVLTLGLGIGVNTTMFISANAVLFRPFPYEHPEQLVAIESNHRLGRWSHASMSYPDFADLRAQTTSFAAMAAYSGRSFNLATGNADPERVEGGQVSAGLFPMLGIAPAIGRTFRDDEDVPGAAPVVLLSDGLWRRQFGGDSAVVGRAITLNTESYTVVGVMPKGFNFPSDQQLWTPLRLSPTENRGNHYLKVMGRLEPGVSTAQAAVEALGIARRLEATYPETNANNEFGLNDLRAAELDDVQAVIFIMLGAVGFVLLIACANVANLLLARAATRTREIAIRTALGAGRRRIIRQLLTESLLLAAMGAGLGLLIAVWGNDLIDAAVPADRPFWMVFTLDWRVLSYVAAVALGTGLLFGLAPALQLSRPNLNENLKEGGQGAGTGRGGHRLRHGLVVAEVALSLVLLVGAGLMVRSFLEMRRADPGFDRSNLLAMRVYLTGAAYDSAGQRAAYLREALPRLASVPGVVDVAAINNVPLGGSSSNTSVIAEGHPVRLGEAPSVDLRITYGDVIRTLGVPLRRGRALTPAETAGSAPVAVINETMATNLWPGEDPIGRRLQMGVAEIDPDQPWYTVVGVTKDVSVRRLYSRPANQVFLPYHDYEFRTMAFLVRTAGDPTALMPALRAALREQDATLPVFDVRTMEAQYRLSFWDRRLYGQMFAVFAMVALLLAAVGLYAVIAYTVSQRTREIGVRVALGAGVRDVLRMVVGQGARLAGVGLLIGLVGAVAAARTLTGLLFGVTATDPFTFVAVALLLGGIAVAASWIPARRAARVDPMTALRAE